MEARLRRKNGYTTTQNLLQVLNSMNTEFINNPNLPQTEEEDDEEKETYFSAGSCFSRCSSASGEVFSQCSHGSREVFFSPRSCLSRCSSKKVTKFFDANERCSKTKEPCHCEGWPFGLCKNAMLLPPLPNSPSESWSWSKGPPHLVKRWNKISSSSNWNNELKRLLNLGCIYGTSNTVPSHLSSNLFR